MLSILPIPRLRIIRSKFNHNDIRPKEPRLLEVLTLPIGRIPIFQQSPPTVPEISQLKPLPKHFSQLRGITLECLVFQSAPFGDTISHPSNLENCLFGTETDWPNKTQQSEYCPTTEPSKFSHHSSHRLESIPSRDKHSLLPVAIVPDDFEIEEGILPNRTSADIVDDPFL